MDRQTAIDRITETENLTDGLEDDDANWLLDWGIARVDGLLAGVTDEDAAGEKLNELMAVMRALNQIAADRTAKPPDALAADIRTFLERYQQAFGAPKTATAPTPAPAADVKTAPAAPTKSSDPKSADGKSVDTKGGPTSAQATGDTRDAGAAAQPSPQLTTAPQTSHQTPPTPKNAGSAPALKSPPVGGSPEPAQRPAKSPSPQPGPAAAPKEKRPTQASPQPSSQPRAQPPAAKSEAPPSSPSSPAATEPAGEPASAAPPASATTQSSQAPDQSVEAAGKIAGMTPRDSMRYLLTLAEPTKPVAS